MRWLFISSTGLQFLAALALVEEKKSHIPDFEADLILIRRRRETLRIAEILQKIRSFRRVFVLDSDSIASLKHILKDPGNFIPRILNRFKSTRYLAMRLAFESQLPLDYGSYSDFFTASRTHVCQWIIEHLPETCRIHHYEDGIGTYTNSKLWPEEEDFYLFEPFLASCSQNFVHRIPKLSSTNSSTRYVAQALCENRHISFPPVLYVDQYWGANTIRSTHPSETQQALWDKRIELLDMVIKEEGVERCGILIQPASKPDEVAFLQDRFGKNVVIDLQGIPFEACLLAGIQCPEKIYTISSSAAFYWKIACHIPMSAKMIFLVRSFQFDYRGLTSMPEILEKLRHLYPDLVEIR